MFGDELFAVQNLTLELQVGGGGGQYTIMALAMCV